MDAIRVPDVLPILPLPAGAVVFPMEVVPISVRRENAIKLLEDAMSSTRMVGLLARRSEGNGALQSVGTAGAIQRMTREDDGSVRVLVQGIERIRVGEPVQTAPYLIARVTPIPDRIESPNQVEALSRTVRDLQLELAGAKNLPEPVAAVLRDLTADPLQLVYLVAEHMKLSTEERQRILEIDPLEAKLRRMLERLQHEKSVRDLGKKIESQTREELSKTQREFILREQLKQIQRELGEAGDGGNFEDLRKKIEASGMPGEARKEVDRERSRLERMPEASPEHGMIRSYLDWMAALPWSNFTAGAIDIQLAQRVLDEDHYDLEKVKDRILEHLAVKKLREERAAAGKPRTGDGPTKEPYGPTVEGEPVRPDSAGPVPALAEEEAARGDPILCFVGPPGVGKTSLGQSIARAMGRKFVRLSLGGVHDESEIRGHRRTYIGAMPGRFIQAIRRAGVGDPVFMLDEIDKLGAGFHGDPSAALLEVLDPAQNRNFMDTYLGVAFDLSPVFFICTANTVDTIPPPLRDRMEIIQLGGYAEEEKLHIARRYILPKLVRAHGLREDEIAIQDDAIRRVIEEHTREAGVRSLERVLAEVLRKMARRMGEGQQPPFTVTRDSVGEILGRPKFHRELAEQLDRPGIALGLAWTPVGGEVLFIEAAMMAAREEQLILTGMLGDVMRESARTALSYLRAQGERFGIPPTALEAKTVHLHVPAGAIPKDGPSAGVAMLTALASLASGRVVREDVAMTGEISLRGKVLPVGGIKEKVLAAFRAGVKIVLLPRRNEGDLDDLPEEVRKAIRFELMDSVEQVLDLALSPEPELEMWEAPEGPGQEWPPELGPPH